MKYFISKNYFPKFPVDNGNLFSNSIPHCRYNGPSRFTTANTPNFLTFPPDFEEGEFFYADLCEKAKDFKPAEALLLYCISEEYLKRNDYILQHRLSVVCRV